MVGLVCNDEGRLEGLPLNRAPRTRDGNIYDIVAGTFFTCGLSGEDLTDFSNYQAAKSYERFKSPEVHFYGLNSPETKRYMKGNIERELFEPDENETTDSILERSGFKLLNSKSVHECTETEERVHNKEVVGMLERLSDILEFEKSVIAKIERYDIVKCHETSYFAFADVHVMQDSIMNQYDIKNGMDIGTSLDGGLAMAACSSGYEINHHYDLIKHRTTFHPFDFIVDDFIGSSDWLVYENTQKVDIEHELEEIGSCAREAVQRYSKDKAKGERSCWRGAIMSTLFFNTKYKKLSGIADLNKCIEYYNRDDRADKNQPSMMKDDEANDMFSYYFYRKGSSSCFDFQGDKPYENIMEEYQKYKPTYIWQSVISFIKEDAADFGLRDKRGFAVLIRKVAVKMAQGKNIPLKDVAWGEFYHVNTDRPHVHFCFYDKRNPIDNTLLSSRSISRIRAAIAREAADRNLLLKGKEDASRQMPPHMRGIINDDKLLKELQSYRALRIIEVQRYVNPKFHLTKGFFDQFQKLDEIPPKTERLSYNVYTLEPYLGEIDHMIEIMLK